MTLLKQMNIFEGNLISLVCFLGCPDFKSPALIFFYKDCYEHCKWTFAFSINFCLSFTIINSFTFFTMANTPSGQPPITPSKQFSSLPIRYDDAGNGFVLDKNGVWVPCMGIAKVRLCVFEYQKVVSKINHIPALSSHSQPS